MKRLGALVAAIAMIVGAAFVSDAIHSDEASSDDGGPPSTPGAKVRVVCASEFEEACSTLQADEAVADVAVFRIERPGVTADALADDAPSFDLWLTSDPWPGVAAIRAGGDAGLGAPAPPLASTSLDVVATSPRTAALERACGSTGLDATCVFGVGATPFDDLGVAGDRVPARFGVAPTTETAGLLTLAAFAEAWFDGTGFDVTDVDIDVDFRSRLSRLADTTVESGDRVGELLTIPKFSLAVDLNAAHQLAGTAKGGDYRVSALGPRAVAVAVPADTAAGSRALDVIGRATVVAAITDAGWVSADGPPTSLPDPAVLDDLATRWNAS